MDRQQQENDVSRRAETGHESASHVLCERHWIAGTTDFEWVPVPIREDCLITAAGECDCGTECLFAKLRRHYDEPRTLRPGPLYRIVWATAAERYTSEPMTWRLVLRRVRLGHDACQPWRAVAVERVPHT